MRPLIVAASLLVTHAARAAGPPALAGAPADGAVAAYVEVAKLWASPVGGSYRATPGAAERVAAMREQFGFGPEAIAAVAVVIPDLRDPALAERFAVRLVFKEPYDKAKLARALGGKLDAKAGQLLLFYSDGQRRPGVVDVSDPVAVTVFWGVPPETFRAAAAAGPLSGALLAAGSHQLVVGVNRAKLPPLAELARTDEDAKPFAALADADSLTLSGKLADDGSMPVELLAQSGDPAKAKAAGKALATALKFLRTLAALSAAESGKEARRTFGMKDPLGPVGGLLGALDPALKAGAVRDTPAGPVLAVTLASDVPLGAALARFFESPIPFLPPSSDRKALQNNFTQLALALHNHHDAHGALPPPASVDKQGKPLLSWRVAILPFIEQTPLYQQFKLDEPWDSPHNKKVLDENPMPAVFATPGVTKPTDKVTHAQVFVGNGVAFEPGKGMKFNDFTDGTSNTLLVVSGQVPVVWTKPGDIPFDPKADPRKLLLAIRGVTTLAFADGSVQATSGAAAWTPEVLRAVITRAGGEAAVDLNAPPAVKK